MEQRCTFLAYDTICRISVNTEADSWDLLETCEEEARELERTLSMFDPTSELSRLCREAVPGRPMKISPALLSFLMENLAICRLTDGAFDPTVGPLVKLWDFLADTPRIPLEEDIRRTMERVGYQHIAVDQFNKTVTFDRTGIEIDPGAAGKGFALELTMERLREAGIGQAVLDYGGNLFVIGGRDTKDGTSDPWRVAIRDPRDLSTFVGVVPLQNAGIATSSWYEHSFQKNGTIYHHLLNPRTGYPVPLTLRSVSLISSRPLYTDILSTAFFVLGEDTGKLLLHRLRQETGETIEYVAVYDDGRISASPGSGFLPHDTP